MQKNLTSLLPRIEVADLVCALCRIEYFRRTLLFGYAHKAVDNPLVSLLLRDLLVGLLHLQDELDPLDGRHARLGDGRRNPAGHKILEKVLHHASLQFQTEFSARTTI